MAPRTHGEPGGDRALGFCSERGGEYNGTRPRGEEQSRKLGKAKKVAIKVTATFDAQHPTGRSGQRWLSPLSPPFFATRMILVNALAAATFRR
jgi:hypothetical protein